jgi:hypothetical protein
VKLLFVGYGLRDLRLGRTLKEHAHHDVELSMLFWFYFKFNLNFLGYLGDTLRIYQSLPLTFNRKSLLSLLSILLYTGQAKKLILKSDAVLLQGRDRYFEFTYYFLARAYGKKVIFFESAHPGYIYLSTNGVAGDAILIPAVKTDEVISYRDAVLNYCDYLSFACFQVFAVGHRTEFNVVLNFCKAKFQKLFLRQELGDVSSGMKIRNSIIFLDQITDDINFKKFGITPEEVANFINEKYKGRTIYYRKHPRAINKEMLSSLKEYIVDLKLHDGNLRDLYYGNNVFITVNSSAGLEIAYDDRTCEVFVLGKSFFEGFVNDFRRLNGMEKLKENLIYSGYRRNESYVTNELLNTLNYVLQKS